MSKIEEYVELERRDVMGAFRAAMIDIASEQDKLRAKDSRNPLLNLVSINACSDEMNFARNFKSVVLEHMPGELGKSTSLYAAIGCYVELLKQEQVNPKYLAR